MTIVEDQSQYRESMPGDLQWLFETPILDAETARAVFEQARSVWHLRGMKSPELQEVEMALIAMGDTYARAVSARWSGKEPSLALCWRIDVYVLPHHEHGGFGMELFLLPTFQSSGRWYTFLHEPNMPVQAQMVVMERSSKFAPIDPAYFTSHYVIPISDPDLFAKTKAAVAEICMHRLGRDERGFFSRRRVHVEGFGQEAPAS